MTKRPYVSLRVKLDAALLQLGLDPETAELHHNPPLALRGYDMLDMHAQDAARYPDPNDPRYLQWLAPADHKRRTFGPGGEKRITTAGSDIGNIAKSKRLAKKRVEFRAKALVKAGRREGENMEKKGEKPKRRIPSRPFQKRRKP